MKQCLYWFGWIFISIGCIKVQAQFPIFNFSRITTDNGLSNRVVNTLMQDSTGFIWAGTDDGLNRLDGYRIKTFQYQPNNPNSIPNNVVSQIIGKTELYISTESGIAVYDKPAQNFHFLKGANIALQKTFKARLFEDHEGLWICGNDSLYLHKNSVTKAWAYPIPNSLVSYSGKAVKNFVNIINDNNGICWAWQNRFLFKLGKDKLHINQIVPIGTHLHDGITLVKPDNANKNTLWIGTWGNGLFRFDMVTGQSTCLNLDGAVIHALDFYRDITGKEWIVLASDKGLSIIDKQTLEIHDYTPNILENNPAGECFDLLVDRQNILWLATANGIYYAEPQKQWFNTTYISQIIPVLNEKNKYIPQPISKVNDLFYVGLMYGKGFATFNNHWQLQAYQPTLISQSSSQYFKDVKNAVSSGKFTWIACDSGLVKYDVNGKFQAISVPKLTKQAERSSYYKIKKTLAINDSTVIAKSASAIHVFNSKLGLFERSFMHLKNDPNSLPDIYFSDFAIIGADCFITTDNGLLQLNYVTGKWQWVKGAFANNRMQCITMQKQCLWIGTQTGLSFYDPKHKQLVNYYRNDGLSSDNIFSICIDINDRVWLGTANGLTCYEPTKQNFTRFYKESGLPESYINGDLFADDNGRIVVGTIDAITWFYADKVLQQSQPIKADITELLLNNQAINWQIVNGVKQIETSHLNNNISIHFALLSYDNKPLNKYYYLLEGADTKWHENSSGFLQFNNLQPGKYVLYTSSVPKHSAEEDVMYIRIREPFYKTWLFISFSCLLIALILYIIYIIKAKSFKEKILLKQRYDQQLREAEMQTLRSQMNPHFIFNTLNAINGFIIENKTEQASDYLITFSKLMRNILENSKHESITLEKELQTLQLYASLEAARLDYPFTYHVSIDEGIDETSIKIPPLIIQPFVENAIWHGLRNKPSHGNIWLQLSLTKAHVLKISIKDDGIGRTAAGKLKTNQVKHKSYGIEITKSRIEMLHADNSIQMSDNTINHIVAGTTADIYLNIL